MRDSDVRAAVRAMLSEAHSGDSQTRIVEEMGVWSGSVRIDLAVINGELCGYELKSDRDTLERLPFQSMIYGHVFDRVVLVVGEKHAKKARQQIPRWWGITVARCDDNNLKLMVDRQPQLNPTPDPCIIAQLLWKDEAISVLDRWGLADGWRSKRAKDIHRRLAQELSFDDLRQEVRESLKARSGWLRQVDPDALNMSAHSDLDPSL